MGGGTGRKKQAVIDTLSDREKIIIQAMETAGFLFTLWEGRSEITFSAGEFGYPSVFKTWDEAYAWINEAQLKDTPGLREQVQAILHPALDEKGQLSQAAPAAQHELTNEEYAQANLIPGETEFEQDGRRYRVHSVDLATGQVELTDLTFAQSAGFPILRVERIDTIRAYLEHPAPPEPPREPKNPVPQHFPMFSTRSRQTATTTASQMTLLVSERPANATRTTSPPSGC